MPPSEKRINHMALLLAVLTGGLMLLCSFLTLGSPTVPAPIPTLTPSNGPQFMLFTISPRDIDIWLATVTPARTETATAQFITPMANATSTPLSTMAPTNIAMTESAQPTVHAARQTATPTPPLGLTPTLGVEASTTPDLNALLAEALNRLPVGSMAFNPPPEMRLGNLERVELRIVSINQELGEVEIHSTLTTGLLGSAEPTVEPINVSTVMRAELTSIAFEIFPLSEEEQIVSSDTYTQWTWDIMPIKSGEHNLNLRVTAKVIAEGLGERSRDLQVKTKLIKVRINPAYSAQNFIGNYWQWLATTLLIPIFLWLRRLYSAREDKKKREERAEKHGRRPFE